MHAIVATREVIDTAAKMITCGSRPGAWSPASTPVSTQKKVNPWVNVLTNSVTQNSRRLTWTWQHLLSHWRAEKVQILRMVTHKASPSIPLTFWGLVVIVGHLLHVRLAVERAVELLHAVHGTIVVVLHENPDDADIHKVVEVAGDGCRVETDVNEDLLPVQRIRIRSIRSSSPSSYSSSSSRILLLLLLLLLPLLSRGEAVSPASFTTFFLTG